MLSVLKWMESLMTKTDKGFGGYCCARSFCVTFAEVRSLRVGILTSDGGSLLVGGFSQVSKR